MICVRGAFPPEYGRPLTAVVANPPFTAEAENALLAHVPSSISLRSVLLRRRKGHATSIFFLANQRLY